MLTETQLRQLSARIEEALQLSLSDPNSVLTYLIEMASEEICRQLRERTQSQRAAA